MKRFNIYRLELKNINFFTIDIYYYIIFFICLGIHFYISLIGWNNTILDHHSFRQSQTAITAYYVIKEGFQLNYITPVLGAPWSIPFEFPLYQWIVAGIVLLFKTPLDQTGRFVTLLFFYLSLFPAFFIINYFLKNRGQSLLVISFILLNPIYLFWSRTFMIESAAVYFSLMFLWFCIKALEEKDKKYLLYASFFGVFAGMIKITTFLPFCYAIFIIFILFWFKEHKQFSNKNTLIKSALFFFIVIGIPIIMTRLWSSYADYQKNLNPLAQDSLTSTVPEIKTWLFGTLKQRLDLNVWKRIILSSSKTCSWILLGFLFIMSLFLSNRKKLLLPMIFSIIYIMAPLTFTNVYYIHDYYFYANILFLSIAIGFLTIALLDEKKFKVQLLLTIILVTPLLASSFFTYKNKYYALQKNNNLEAQTMSELIKKHTKMDDIILIYGFDYSPAIPYYSERKAIMDMKNLPLKSDKIQKSLAHLGDKKVKAVIFGGNYDKKFIDERIHYFGLNSTPLYDDLYKFPILQPLPVKLYIAE